MANPISGLLRRGREQVQEIVGRTASVMSVRGLWGSKKTVDETIADYEWWDKFRRGKQPGYELSGLLAKPSTEIMASWVGTPDEAVVEDTGAGDVDYTNDLLRRFLRRIRGTWERLMVDLFGLADQYVIVNPDGSLSVPSPDTVDRVYDPVDYRRLTEITVRSNLGTLQISDQYRLDGRTIRIKNTSRDSVETVFGTVAGRETLVAEFENLIGRLPVVHFANDRGTNETGGRPMYAALVGWFGWYNDLLVKALNGAKRLSNPILAWIGLTDIEATKEDNSRDVGATYQDEDGTIQNRSQVDIDEDEPVIFLGVGADAKFIGPQSGFTGDIWQMLKGLYLLFMEHLHLPDVVMGFELSSARASAVEQIKTFYAHIKGRRTALEGEGTDDLLMVEARGGLLAVIDIWLRYKALTDRRVMVGPVTLTWPELDTVDEELTFKWAQYLDKQGYIRAATANKLSGRIEDPEGELEAAEEEDAQRNPPEAWQQEGQNAEADETPMMDDLQAAA